MHGYWYAGCARFERLARYRNLDARIRINQNYAQTASISRGMQRGTGVEYRFLLCQYEYVGYSQREKEKQTKQSGI